MKPLVTAAAAAIRDRGGNREIHIPHPVFDVSVGTPSEFRKNMFSRPTWEN